MSKPAITSPSKEFEFTAREFKFLGKLVYDHTGIVLAEHKYDMVYSRLARRVRALGLKSFAEYCSLIESEQGEEEMVNLVNAITTNLTSFFREAHHFEHLRHQVLMPLIESGQKRIRLWSSACSSGMEPYSMAMVVRECLQQAQGVDIKILATDIDTNMVRKAQEGRYGMAEYEDIPAAYRTHVTRDTQGIRMNESLRSLITFKPLNLLHAWPMKGHFDAVFCRNVVIYFDKTTQAKLFSRMADRLTPEGWLYIGHSENISTITHRFHLTGRTIYRRIK